MMDKPRFIETELGTERLCKSCEEYWPNDAEFFFRSKGYFTGNCKACFYEKHRDQRARNNARHIAKRSAQRAVERAEQALTAA